MQSKTEQQKFQRIADETFSPSQSVSVQAIIFFTGLLVKVSIFLESMAEETAWKNFWGKMTKEKLEEEYENFLFTQSRLLQWEAELDNRYVLVRLTL